MSKKAEYNENYYKNQWERFNDSNYNIFNIYYKKFNFKSKILDYWCWVWLFLDCWNKNFWYKKEDLFWYDVNDYAISKLEEKWYSFFDINNNTKKNFFNSIFCYQVLEHMERYDVIDKLKKMYDLLDKWWKLYIYCPIDYAREIDFDPTHINFMNYYWLINYTKSLWFKIKKNNWNSVLFHKFAMQNIFIYAISNLMYRLFKYKPSSIELILEK